MLLHHARRDARIDPDGRLITLDRQDRSRWRRSEIAEGVAILQAALAQDRLGPYQAQAAIAALHDDCPVAEETDWVQIVQWYDELTRLRPGDPVVALNRAVALGEVAGPRVALEAVAELDADLGQQHRLAAVRAYLHERAGDAEIASGLYQRAAAAATNVKERDHLALQAARLRHTAT
jgi:predicted RNA polymerase sigma factor